MPDKVISVRLRAIVGEYQAAMAQAGATTREFGGQLSALGEKHSKGFQQVGLGAVAAGGAIALGLGMAVKANVEFEKSMSGVAAVAGASRQELAQLSDAAIKAGRDTVFSAAQAAQAEGELAKAGVSTADILGGALRGSLDLAAAGQIDLSESAMIAAQAMNIFHLAGKDVGHIADVLAAGANKSAADVHDLGEALRQGGLLAAQTGLTLEETVGVLSAFADRGLLASDAGTSLKTMLQRLTPQSQEAAQEMDRLGIHAYDASGNFVGLAAFAENLKTSLGGLTDEQRNAALATIFGSDAVRGATILYQQGAAGIQTYIDAVNDQGAASRMAATQLDNLAGDLEQLKGSIETALIQSGSAGNDVLRGLVQGATDAVNTFSALDPWMQQVAVGLGAAASGALLLAGGVALAVPKIRDLQAAIAAIKSAEFASALGTAVDFLTGPLGLALTGATIAVGIFAKSKIDAARNVADFTKAVEDDSGALGQNTRELIATKLEQGGLLERADRLGISLETLTSAILGDKDALQQVHGRIDPLIAGYGKMSEENNRLAGDAAFLEGEIGKQSGALQAAAAAADRKKRAVGEAADGDKQAAGAAQQHAGATLLQAGAAHQAAGATQELTDAQKDLNKEIAGFVDPSKAYQDVLRRNEDAMRQSAEGQAKAHNESIDEQIQAIRDRTAADKDAVDKETRSTLEVVQSAKGRSDAEIAASDATKDAATERKDAIDKASQDEIKALEGQKTSWEDYKTTVTVTVDEYLGELQRQVDAQANWSANMAILAGRVSQSTIQELAKLGPEGAPLVAQLVNASDAELQRLEKLFQTRSATAIDNMRGVIEQAGPLLASIARRHGQAIADEVARGIAEGTGPIADRIYEAALKYGDIFQAGFFRHPAPGGAGPTPSTAGPAVPQFAAGGIVTSPTMGLIGEAGPEAVIPLNDPQRAAQIMRSTGIGGDGGSLVGTLVDALRLVGATMGGGSTTVINAPQVDPGALLAYAERQARLQRLGGGR